MVLSSAMLLTRREQEAKFLECDRLNAPHYNWEPVLKALQGVDGNGRIIDVIDALVLPKAEEEVALA
jgi:patatin-like phospholipase/acyl hydrolase